MKIQFDGVSAEDFDRAQAFLERSGFARSDAHRGKAHSDCTELTYDFDPEAQTLEVDVEELPDDLKRLRAPNAERQFRTLTEVALGRNQSADSDLVGDSCGIYNYVRPKVNNESGGVLTYSTSSTSHGQVKKAANTIENGEETQAFEATSGKGSGLGVEGDVTFLLADGTTKLIMHFWLNGVGMHSFTAGTEGQNAPLYRVTVEDTSPHLDGYTYLKPKVAIKKA